jgi:hypothetical protein
MNVNFSWEIWLMMVNAIINAAEPIVIPNSLLSDVI